MNINAIRAYSQAAGLRPSLPERRREVITDAFDTDSTEVKEKGSSQNTNTAQAENNSGLRSNRYFTGYYTKDFVQNESYEVFTKNGSVKRDEFSKGTIFDGRA